MDSGTSNAVGSDDVPSATATAGGSQGYPGGPGTIEPSPPSAPFFSIHVARDENDAFHLSPESLVVPVGSRIVIDVETARTGTNETFAVTQGQGQAGPCEVMPGGYTTGQIPVIPETDQPEPIPATAIYLEWMINEPPNSDLTVFVEGHCDEGAITRIHVAGFIGNGNATAVPTGASAPAPYSQRGLAAGAIAGIVLAFVALLLIALIFMHKYFRARRELKTKTEAMTQHAIEPDRQSQATLINAGPAVEILKHLDTKQPYTSDRKTEFSV